MIKTISQDQYMIMVYHDAFIEIFYMPSRRKLILIWIGSQTEASILSTGKLVLDLVVKFEIIMILNDNAHVSGSWSGAIAWTRDIWFEDIAEAGVKYFAWILADDEAARQTALEAMPDFELVCSFRTRAAGDAWLETKYFKRMQANARRVAARKAQWRVPRNLLTLNQKDIDAAENSIKTLTHENESLLNDFKQFHLKTRLEQFLVVLRWFFIDYKVRPQDALRLVVALCKTGDLTRLEMIRIFRMLTKPQKEDPE